MADLHYLPGITFYLSLFRSTDVEFNTYEQYRKGGFSNRCLIAGANGVIKLTVPIVGGRDQKSLLRDIVIVKDQNWQMRHFKTIKSCYNHSPWFEQYHDSLAALYEKRVDFLVDWNLECMEWAGSALGWKGRISWIRQPSDDNKPNSGNVKQIAAGEEIIRYRQVFEDRIGFIANLSILDLLFCEGPRARALLLPESNETE